MTGFNKICFELHWNYLASLLTCDAGIHQNPPYNLKSEQIDCVPVMHSLCELPEEDAQ